MDVFTEATVPPHGPTVNSPASGGDAVLPCRGRPRTATTGSRPWRGGRNFYLLNATVIVVLWCSSFALPTGGPLISYWWADTRAVGHTVFTVMLRRQRPETRKARETKLPTSGKRRSRRRTRYAADVGMTAED
ncbi:unnamed protein product [Aphis gossypii]|uniref:Uncharacterized protein n=1 Tax=Aphis gossypii TaxID=80765 RepID=A0A9P0J2B5_APHGO|nr:unnamed protein product [Aphis gossypii]